MGLEERKKWIRFLPPGIHHLLGKQRSSNTGTTRQRCMSSNARSRGTEVTFRGIRKRERGVETKCLGKGVLEKARRELHLNDEEE